MRKRKEHRQYISGLKLDKIHYNEMIQRGKEEKNRAVVKNAKEQKKITQKALRHAQKENNKLLKMILYRNKTVFSLLKAVMNGIWFIVLYFAYIKALSRTPLIWDGLIGLGYTAIGVTVTRLLSWGLAFWITEHNNWERNVQYVLRSALITVVISTMYFFEIFITLYNNLDVKWSVGGYVLIQFLIFTLADFLVDNFLFQH